MKSRKLIYIFIILGYVFLFTNSCKKDNNTSTQIDPKYLPIIFNPNLNYDSITDVDGNVYKTIKIGTQTWMAENLKTTRLNDSTAITLETDNSAWTNSTTPVYCWFNNDISYKTVYGALYSGLAVSTGKLSPKGWHVPSTADWKILISFLGGDSLAGGKLKETGLTHWLSPNTGATNESGFTALPGGCRTYSGFGPSTCGIAWAQWRSKGILSGAADDILGLVLYSNSFVADANYYTPYYYGNSIRCVKD